MITQASDSKLQDVAQSPPLDDLIKQAQWLADSGLTHASAAVARLAYERWLRDAHDKLRGRELSRKSSLYRVERLLIENGVVESSLSTANVRRNLNEFVHGKRDDRNEVHALVLQVKEFLGRPLTFPSEKKAVPTCKSCGGVKRRIDYHLDRSFSWRCDFCHARTMRG